MGYAPVRLIIPSLKLGDYLSVQAHKPCSISHLYSLWSVLNLDYFTDIEIAGVSIFITMVFRRLSKKNP